MTEAIICETYECFQLVANVLYTVQYRRQVSLENPYSSSNNRQALGQLRQFETRENTRTDEAEGGKVGACCLLRWSKSKTHQTYQTYHLDVYFAFSNVQDSFTRAPLHARDHHLYLYNPILDRSKLRVCFSSFPIEHYEAVPKFRE